MRTRSSLVLLPLIAALALVACAPGGVSDPVRAGDVTEVAGDVNGPAAVAIAQDETWLPTDGGECPDLGNQQAADPNQIEQLGGLTILTPRDRGPMPHAKGTPVLNADGQPAAYVVASDDSIQMIATRFCLRPDWIASLNAVRRNAGQELYLGDTLNLDAHTIYSVGTQNGEVHANSIPEGFTIPPQR